MSRKKAQKEMAAPISEVSSPEKDSAHSYEVEDAVRTLERAEKIKGDEKMMGHVHKHINSKVKTLKGLKKLGIQKDVDEANEM